MHNIQNMAFLARGFRPFFLVGALFSFISIFIWASGYTGYIVPPEIMGDSVFLHAHEMVFGYTMAIVAGFLLTAVANWTGGAPVRQYHLLGLVLLWTFARIVINFQLDIPDILFYILSLSFIPALTISLSIPLIKSWNKRNFVFLILLSLLFSFDTWSLLTGDRTPIYLAIFVIMIMISLIGGRIIPAFTVAGLRRMGIELYQKDQPKMDILALVSLGLVIISFLTENGILISIFSFISFLVHLVRMKNYHVKLSYKDPMIWILHLGYLWLVIGLFLLGLYGLEIITLVSVIHAMTTGAIGSMTLGMITRVAMGHTGRIISANIATIIAFVLMQITAIIRVFMPLIFPELSEVFIVISGFTWTACFLIYLCFYTHILFLPRPDGRPA